MGTTRRHPHRRSAAIAVGIVAVIIYGSLYPFRFYDNPDPNGPFYALLATWHTASGRGDLISNFLLYVPLGFFCVRSGKLPLRYSFIVAAAVGITLSTLIE